MSQYLKKHLGKTSTNFHRFIYCHHYNIPLKDLSCNVDIHHIDGDIYNNNIDNLISLSESEHIRLHHLGRDNGNRFKICEWCNKTYDSRYGNRHTQRRFCSRSCGDDYRARNQVTLFCQQCNKEYKTKKSHSINSKFCSKKCKDDSMRRWC